MAATKSYSLQKVGDQRFLVIGTDYTRFDELVPEVEEDLKKKDFNGVVIFDLLLSNGNNSSRFFEVLFNYGKIDPSTLKKINIPDPVIVEKIKKYLLRHIEILNNGVLSSAEIKRISVSLQE